MFPWNCICFFWHGVELTKLFICRVLLEDCRVNIWRLKRNHQEYLCLKSEKIHVNGRSLEVLMQHKLRPIAVGVDIGDVPICECQVVDGVNDKMDQTTATLGSDFLEGLKLLAGRPLEDLWRSTPGISNCNIMIWIHHECDKQCTSMCGKILKVLKLRCRGIPFQDLTLYILIHRPKIRNSHKGLSFNGEGLPVIGAICYNWLRDIKDSIVRHKDQWVGVEEPAVTVYCHGEVMRFVAGTCWCWGIIWNKYNCVKNRITTNWRRFMECAWHCTCMYDKVPGTHCFFRKYYFWHNEFLLQCTWDCTMYVTSPVVK